MVKTFSAFLKLANPPRSNNQNFFRSEVFSSYRFHVLCGLLRDLFQRKGAKTQRRKLRSAPGLRPKSMARIGWAWRIILCSFSPTSVRPMDTKLQFSAAIPAVLSLLAVALLARSVSGADAQRRILRGDRAVLTTRAAIPTNVIGGTAKTDGTNG